MTMTMTTNFVIHKCNALKYYELILNIVRNITMEVRRQ